MKSFFDGLLTPFQAFRLLLSQRSLMLLATVPILFSILILTGLIWAFSAGFATWAQAQIGSTLGTVSTVIFSLILIFASIQVTGLIANLLAIPFNDLLAEKTEKIMKVSVPQRSGFGHLYRLARLDAVKTILYLVLWILFTIGTWIPVIGLVFFIGIALINTLNFVSYPQSRRLLGFWSSIGWVQANAARSLGFGMITTVLLMIPLVNILALPISVVGGTLTYLDSIDSRSQ